MLKRLTLRYFQSHRRTIINLHPGVNIFCGISMAGKTAIKRALKKLVLNRPVGYNYHSDVAPKRKSFIKGLFDNGSVELRHIKNNLLYICNNNIKDPYRKFGTNVPDEVKQICNMKEINFQDQSANPFIDSKPSEMAREINRITQQELISKWIKSSNQKISKTKSRIELLDEEIKEKKEELKRFRPLKKLRKTINKANVLNTKINEASVILQRLTGLNKEKSRLDFAISRYDEAIELYEGAEVLAENIFNHQQIIEKGEEQKTLARSISITKKEISKLKKEYLKALGNRCLYCFSKVDQKVVEKMI